MTLIGAAIIGFLVGLVFCYWKQLQSAYQNRETIGAVSDVVGGAQTAAGGLQTIWQKL